MPCTANPIAFVFSTLMAKEFNPDPQCAISFSVKGVVFCEFGWTWKARLGRNLDIAVAVFVMRSYVRSS